MKMASFQEVEESAERGRAYREAEAEEDLSWAGRIKWLKDNPHRATKDDVERMAKDLIALIESSQRLHGIHDIFRILDGMEE